MGARSVLRTTLTALALALAIVACGADKEAVPDRPRMPTPKMGETPPGVGSGVQVPAPA